MGRTFTVLVPNYNGGAFVARCVESVLSQSHEELEVVVVDARSTDDSHAVVDELARRDPRVRRITEPVDRGLSDAVNIGIAAARGDYVVWLGSDDRLVDEHVLRDVDTFLDARAAAALPAPVLCYGGYQIDWTRTGKVEDRVKRDVDLHLMWFTDAIMCGNVFFDPRFCRDQGIEVDETLRFAMDYDLWMQVLRRVSREQVACIPDRFIHLFAMREDNITGGDVLQSTREARGVALRYARNPAERAGIYALTAAQMGYQLVRARRMDRQVARSSAA